MLTVTILFLMVEIACGIPQKCPPRVYSVIRTGGPSFPADETMSSHIINSGIVPIECYELCQKEPKCVGFNYREKINVVNCQLTNIIGKRDHIEMMEEGEWILMNDEEVAKNKKKGKTDKMISATSCAKSCADLYKSGVRRDGVFIIDPDGLGSFRVRCDMSTDGGGWTVFQRRQDGSQDFFLKWPDYKAGFGNLSGEFWLGFDKIHRLSKSGQNVLRVDLMDFDYFKAYAKYETFSVADETDKYRLTVGNFSGNAGDSLNYHNQMQFSTKDNVNSQGSVNCALRWQGAWWYNNCHVCNLNGLYSGSGGTGVQWQGWKKDVLKQTEMKVRGT